MTLHTDMQAPLTEIARCRAMVAQGLTGAAVAERMGAALACLEDVAVRVEAAFTYPVPEHWRHQRAATFDELRSGAVVSLVEARQARAVAKVVRL
jgi:hypothetical protein